MNKVALGVFLGGVLGVFDGLTAWFTPEVRNEILGIIIGSTFKGVVAGLLIGLFARKVDDMKWTIPFGILVAGTFAFFVAHMQGKYYFEIMLPGAIVGLITGYATERYGRGPAPKAEVAR
ncbi:MAG: hypothetical protein HYX75_16575 [Acidobacteria bacterium]|nr:hypothetical protein [Acidobacteriota bacterium]